MKYWLSIQHRHAEGGILGTQPLPRSLMEMYGILGVCKHKEWQTRLFATFCDDQTRKVNNQEIIR